MQKMCYAVYVVRGIGKTVLKLLVLCVKFNRDCHRKTVDLCCGVCVFFATHERQVLLLRRCDKLVVIIRSGQAAV